MRGKTGNIRDDILQRSWVVAIGLIILGALVIYRIFYIQHYDLYKGKPWIEYMSKTVRVDTIPAMRGNIYSNDGSLMATSLPYFEVSIDPTVADSVYFYTGSTRWERFWPRLLGNERRELCKRITLCPTRI